MIQRYQALVKKATVIDKGLGWRVQLLKQVATT